MDNNSSSSKSVTTEDQIFVLCLIMGIYFGPDLKDETSKKSALRRMIEGPKHYSSDQLAGTCFNIAQVEKLYYYVLRNADHSAILTLPVFYQFFYGLLPVQGSAAPYPQLNDLFPPHLHPLRLHNGHNVIENIVFVNDPDVSYISPWYVEKFKTLTGLQNLFLDGYRVGEKHDHNGLTKAPLSASNTANAEDFDNAMLVFPTPPSKEELTDIVATTKRGYALTGSAATGQIGPAIGLLDIGESEDSYLFRVSLPGVKRDESDFNCEVEEDGTVTIKGVTTHAENTVTKHSQVFEMQSQNICPPGHFSISFKLPGPVNTQQFLGTFCTDAILEGLIGKAGQNGQ